MKRIEFDQEDGFKVIAGTERSQAAVMVLDVGQSTGGPTNLHRSSDQWLYVVSGQGEATVEGENVTLGPGTLLLIEAQETHEIWNTGNSPLRTLNVYSPPEY